MSCSSSALRALVSTVERPAAAAARLPPIWTTVRQATISRLKTIRLNLRMIPSRAGVKDYHAIAVLLFSKRRGAQGESRFLPPILNAQGLAKAYGASLLFQNVSFTISEGERIGLIGPNGSGKSTLLGILAGRIDPDAGELATRKHARLSYVTQESQFVPGRSVRRVTQDAMARAAVADSERANLLAQTLGRGGFDDFD